MPRISPHHELEPASAPFAAPRRVGLVLFLALALASSSAFGFGLPLQPLNVQLEDRTSVDIASLTSEGAGPASELSWMFWKWIGLPTLDEVVWTASHSTTVDRLAGRWGLRRDHFLALNPGLSKDTPIEAGQRFVVYRLDPEHPSRSIGRPHRGHLENAVAFPEGPFWQLREYRHRHWGTRLNVQSMLDALMVYGRRYPFGPPLRIGELSKPRGGYLKPHRSHRTGRDIDFGYIGFDNEASGNWVRVDHRSIDPERTWFFLKALIATGNVQSMYIDKSLQKVLSKEAAKELNEKELAAIFEFPRRPNSHRAIIQHWPGHRDHAHVRFHCEPWNALCKPW